MTQTHDQGVTGPIDSALRVRIGDMDVTLISDLEETTEDFAALYPDRTKYDQTPDRTIRMEIRKSKRSLLGRRRYYVCGDGEPMGPAHLREEVLPYLEWAINWRVIARRTDYLQLHAATLVHGGCGVIFAGDSGQGKTTLAAGLLARGWSYLSDEFALIDPATTYIHPFPKALCIKAGAFDLIRQLKLPLRQRRYVKAQKGAVGYIPPLSVGPDAIGRPAPVRLVIFPKYDDGRPPHLRPIPRAQAVLALAQCAFNRKLFGQRTTSILSRLVRGARCFAMTTGPIDQTCDMVESLLAEQNA